MNTVVNIYQDQAGNIIAIDGQGNKYRPAVQPKGLGYPGLSYDQLEDINAAAEESQSSGWLSNLFNAIGGAFVKDGKATDLTSGLLTLLNNPQNPVNVPIYQGNSVGSGYGYQTTQAGVPSWLIVMGLLVAAGTTVVVLKNKKSNSK